MARRSGHEIRAVLRKRIHREATAITRQTGLREVLSTRMTPLTSTTTRSSASPRMKSPSSWGSSMTRRPSSSRESSGRRPSTCCRRPTGSWMSSTSICAVATNSTYSYFSTIWHSAIRSFRCSRNALSASSRPWSTSRLTSSTWRRRASRIGCGNYRCSRNLNSNIAPSYLRSTDTRTPSSSQRRACGSHITW